MECLDDEWPPDVVESCERPNRRRRMLCEGTTSPYDRESIVISEIEITQEAAPTSLICPRSSSSFCCGCKMILSFNAPSLGESVNCDGRPFFKPSSAKLHQPQGKEKNATYRSLAMNIFRSRRSFQSHRTTLIHNRWNLKPISLPILRVYITSGRPTLSNRLKVPRPTKAKVGWHPSAIPNRAPKRALYALRISMPRRSREGMVGVALTLCPGMDAWWRGGVVHG